MKTSSTYTCHECGSRQITKWYGKERYLCRECGNTLGSFTNPVNCNLDDAEAEHHRPEPKNQEPTINEIMNIGGMGIMIFGDSNGKSAGECLNLCMEFVKKFTG